MEDVVDFLLFEEMHRKYFEMYKEVLFVHRRSKEKGKKNEKKSKSKSLGSSNSLGKNSKAKCWNCDKSGHFWKDCGSVEKCIHLHFYTLSGTS